MYHLLKFSLANFRVLKSFIDGTADYFDNTGKTSHEPLYCAPSWKRKVFYFQSVKRCCSLDVYCSPCCTYYAHFSEWISHAHARVRPHIARVCARTHLRNSYLKRCSLDVYCSLCCTYYVLHGRSFPGDGRLPATGMAEPEEKG